MFASGETPSGPPLASVAAADVAENSADIEDRNLRDLLDSDSRASDAFNKIGKAPEGGFTGAGHVEQSSQAAEDAYAAIRADTGDVSSIAQNTGINEDVVAQGRAGRNGPGAQQLLHRRRAHR